MWIREGPAILVPVFHRKNARKFPSFPVVSRFPTHFRFSRGPEFGGWHYLSLGIGLTLCPQLCVCPSEEGPGGRCVGEPEFRLHGVRLRRCRSLCVTES